MPYRHPRCRIGRREARASHTAWGRRAGSLLADELLRCDLHCHRVDSPALHTYGSSPASERAMADDELARQSPCMQGWCGDGFCVTNSCPVSCQCVGPGGNTQHSPGTALGVELEPGRERQRRAGDDGEGRRTEPTDPYPPDHGPHAAGPGKATGQNTRGSTRIRFD